MKRLRNPDGTYGPYYIYALKHPLTGAIGYIGVTENPRQRFQQHAYPGRGKVQNDRSLKAQWIRELAKASLAPVMEILEVITDTRSLSVAELNWQWWARDRGTVVENFESQCRPHSGMELPAAKCHFRRVNGRLVEARRRVTA